MLQIKKQLSKLYIHSALWNFSLCGAWVALLAARGFSLVEIGFAETVFHIASLLFEIPSGVLADVFGRKKMLIVSCIMRIISNVIIIFSVDLFTVCVSMVFNALGYNFLSGSDSALAYDSMKLAGEEDAYERYESNQMLIYRLCNGASTLLTGFSLFIGYKLAYAVSIPITLLQIAVLATVREVYGANRQKVKEAGIWKSILVCFRESFAYLSQVKRAVGLMLCNALVGAIALLLLFFMQAKLPEKGIPAWGIGLALLIVEMGGIAGAKLVLKVPKVRYSKMFLITTCLVLSGVLAEHAPAYWVVILGGFIATAADDALQIRTNTLLQNMFPSEQRATLTSVESFAFSIIMIILSPLAGFFFTYW